MSRSRAEDNVRGVLGLGLMVAIAMVIGSLTNVTGITNIPVLPGGSAEVTLYNGEMQGVRQCNLGPGDALAGKGGLANGLSAEERNRACWDAKRYAYQKVVVDNYFGSGNTLAEFHALDLLWVNESNWDPWIVNMSTYAQFIPQAIRSIHGEISKPGEWHKQIEWGLQYIKGRYKTPSAALAFWQRTDPRPYPGHWY